MRAYVDSSVLLRIAFGEADVLSGWGQISEPVSSELIRIECLRTIDRARLRGRLEDLVLARIRADVLEIIDTFSLISLGDHIQSRAAEPLPTQLGTLDALHLASALTVRASGTDPPMATHHRALATGAEALGFEVIS